MRALMGLIRNKYGVYQARKKVPKRLEAAVAKVLGRPKAKQSWLKRSLDTKDLNEAKKRVKAVQIEFDRTLERARALLVERPVRTKLSPIEIKRMAEYHYGRTLSAHDEFVRFGPDEARAMRDMLPDEDWAEAIPQFGLTRGQMLDAKDTLARMLPEAEVASAQGNIAHIEPQLDRVLDDFQIDLDRASDAYKELGIALLREHVRALRALKLRGVGEPIPTPALALPSPGVAGEDGGKLSAAIEGWKKERSPAPGTLREYERAINLFTELHGDLPVIQINRAHARQFREALQMVPRHRTGALLTVPLPEVVEWSKEHPTAKRITAATINKQLGGVQAVVIWARDKGGFIRDDIHWADPFARMRLEEDEPEREPFEIAELNTLFQSEVFTAGSRPEGGRGEAAYWLPLLALHAGGRRGELAALKVRDVLTDEVTKAPLFSFTEERESGKSLKTRNSQRVVPVHPQLIKLGFLDYVESVRHTRGGSAWLFPQVAPDEAGAQAAWTKWFGRYLRNIGITDAAKVFHSLRHNFVDALRAATSDEELREALSGHGWRRTTNRDYGAKAMIRRFTVPRLVKAINGVSYPGLVLAHLQKVKPQQRKSVKG